MRRFFFAIAFIFIMWVVLPPAILEAGPGAPVLLVEGEPYTAEGPLEMIEDEVFIPLRVLVTAFGAQLRWMADEQGYLVVMEGIEVKFRADQKSITVNGRPQDLKHAPRVVGGRTMVPLEMIAAHLPVITRWNPAMGRLDLRRPLNELTMLCADLNADGRPVVALESRGDLGTYQLVEEQTRPDRVVIDFFGMKSPVGLSTLNRGNPLVRRMFWELRATNRLRVTIELKRKASFRLVRYPGESDHLEVHFDYALRDAVVAMENGWPRILLDTGGATEYRVFALSAPNRVVIDLVNTVSVLESSKLPGDGTMVTAIRSSQMDARTTRVVLDLAAARPFRVSPVPGEKGRLAVDFPRRLSAVSWIEGTLSIRGEGSLSGRIVTDFGPEGARVDLLIPNATVAGLGAIRGEHPQVKSAVMHDMPTGEARIRLALAQYGGAKAASTDDGQFRLYLTPSTLVGKIIVLDAGHGGRDSGAVSPKGLQEKGINLDVVNRLIWRLKASGAEIVLTRTDDTFIALYDRPKIANDAGAHAFISIHSNFHPTDPNCRGIETFHHPARPESARLAKIVQTEVLSMTGLTNRGVKTSEGFVVTRETAMPAVLLEIGFLSNVLEEHLLRTDAYRDVIADAVIEALLKFFSEAEIRNEPQSQPAPGAPAPTPAPAPPPAIPPAAPAPSAPAPTEP